jgi:hypothetical protein
MKMLIKITLALSFYLSLTTCTINAQEEKSNSPFSVGADFVSNYVWRGTKLGTGPNIQPYVEFGIAGLKVGSWGSFAFNTTSVVENDFYLSYDFDFGLSLGVTDYYYQGPLFNFTDSLGSHAVELNGSYEIAGLSLSANYIINEAGGAGSAGGDIYFEAMYSFENFDVFLGAGDGWHTTTGSFEVVNVGISTSKEIKITENFSLPVFGSVIVNPQQEVAYVIAGFTF